MIYLLKSELATIFIFLFFSFKVKMIAMFGGQLRSADIGWENNAIFSQYSSPDKSCQGQTQTGDK